MATWVKKKVSQQNLVSSAKMGKSIGRQPMKAVITGLSHDHQGRGEKDREILKAGSWR